MSTCRTCSYRVVEPHYNQEPDAYFCGNPRTKKGPNPIGYIREDAPACGFYRDQNAKRARRPAKRAVEALSPLPTAQVVIMIQPMATPAAPQASVPEVREKRSIDEVAARRALQAVGIAGALAFAVEHVVRFLEPLKPLVVSAIVPLRALAAFVAAHFK